VIDLKSSFAFKRSKETGALPLAQAIAK